MKTGIALGAMVISTTAWAGSVSGPGGIIPSNDTGGGGMWDRGQSATALPTAPSTFSVVVPDGIASVDSIVMTGLSHTWVGDLHAVLVDPSGAMHNIFVRPGLFDTSAFGNPGIFDGDYEFVESGAPNNLPTTSFPGVNPPPGQYNQTFGGSTAVGANWVDGNLGIFNTPMNSISGPAGTWSLRFYDWEKEDKGALGSWTLNYTAIPAPGVLVLTGLAGLVGSRRRRR